MNRARATRRVAAILTAVLAAPSCGGGSGDRAGGPDAQPETTVLVMAQPTFGPPAPVQLTLWAEEVERRSNSTLRIEFAHDWRRGEADFEAETVEDVRQGDADLGWIGARGFDQVGVTSFQALVAPMVIDSYDLEEAVFAAGIPAEMLKGTADAGVHGLAVLPGPLRRVLGLDRPFVRPEDFEGAVIGIQASEVAAQSFAALGATTRALPQSAELVGVDAYEHHVSSIVGNHYWDVARHLTTNVNLWPRPLVVFVKPQVFDGLTATQQEALTSAGEAVLDDSMAAARAEDDPFVQLCQNDVTLVQATQAELDQLRATLAPVLTALAEDDTTARFLQEIMELRADRDDPPDALMCAVDEEASDAATGAFPEGSYEMTLHLTDGRQDGGCYVDDYDVVDFHMQLTDGVLTMYVTYPTDGGREEFGVRARYEIFRDRISLFDPVTDEPGLTARWTFDGTNLVFDDVQNSPGCGDTAIFASQPWRRVG